MSRGIRQAGARDSAIGTCRRLYLGGENREICQRSAGTCACPWLLQRGRRLSSSGEPSSPRCVIGAGRPALLPGSVCLSFAALQVRRLESRKRGLLTCCPCLGWGMGTPASSVLCAGATLAKEAILPSFLCGYSQGFLFHCVAEVSPVAS